MRPLYTKLFVLAFLGVIIGSQTGCESVKPWQRKTLADYTMRGDRDPLDDGLKDHIFFSREMAAGGKGVGGGGCGCN